MRFTPGHIAGVHLVVPEPVLDERGFFARTWCSEEFAAHGLNVRLAQCSISYNLRRGTLRGLHYQAAPHQEAKLVRCTQGAIYDVVADVRPGSKTHYRWQSFELSARNRNAVYVPEGCAHGFQALEDETEVLYQISEAYRAELARGVRWDDPALAIDWPLPNPVLSDRDRSHPALAPC